MERSDGVADLVVRLGVPDDLDAVAAMFSETRLAVPMMPPPVHTPDEDRAFLSDQLHGDREAWVAELDGEVVGLLLLEDDWVHSLYVAAGRTGQGIGTVLLDLAKGVRPDGLQLWVRVQHRRQAPLRARGLRRGRAHRRRRQRGEGPRRADGGRGDLAELRGRIDEVDDRLADLLNERAALTAEVQRRKTVPGHAGRDAEREAEIVARMAARTPNLGPERVAAIMHTVIAVSLDAAGDAVDADRR